MANYWGPLYILVLGALSLANGIAGNSGSLLPEAHKAKTTLPLEISNTHDAYISSTKFCIELTRESYLPGKWFLMLIVSLSYIGFFALIWNAPWISSELRLVLLLLATIANFAFASVFFSEPHFQPIYNSLASKFLCAS